MTDSILPPPHAALHADLLRLLELHRDEAAYLVDRGAILGPTVMAQRWTAFAHGLRDTAALVMTIATRTPARPLAATLTPYHTRTR